MLHSSQSAPVVDGKVMEFVIFAIESAAQKLGIPAPTLYNRCLLYTSPSPRD